MVKWVADRGGRFPQRPYYTQQELDQECEAIVGRFLRARRGKVAFPLSTNDLTILVEQHCSDVDQYADLSAEGPDVEGMTEFFPDIAPRISISERLATDERRENRLRTTLAHELGHAHFHRMLFADLFAPSALFARRPSDAKVVCKRDTILDAREVDWMEWQAGYASGAFLMPAPALRQRVSDFCAARGFHAAVHVDSPEAREMQVLVTEAFQVSMDAARIRLLKLGFLTDRQVPPSLFG
jgi:Zn-dependent peptidase ImmA (M78 family)